MRTMITMALRVAVCLVAISALPTLAAQEARTESTRAQQRDAEAQAQLAKAVQHLDVLLDQVRIAQDSVRIALEQARQAEIKAKAADLERATRITAELLVQLDGLSAAINTHFDRLRELRAKAADEVPPSMVDDLAPLRERIMATAGAQTLAEAEAALAGMEKDLSADDMRNKPGIDELLGLARYRLADTLRLEATAAARVKSNDKEAERLLQRAVRKYTDVLTTPDSSVPEEGSSLHAAALRRVVQIEAVIYDGYKQLSTRYPQNRGYSDNARTHRKAAEEAFGKLQRLHPDATLPDGTRAVDAARADANRIAR